jgi:hypothetical protein
MERMTCQVELAVGARSEVTASWHEPPPWTALPSKESVCSSPIAMGLFSSHEALKKSGEPVVLQGKLAPLEVKGLLSGFGWKGLGLTKIMCEDTVEAQRRAARAEMLKVLEVNILVDDLNGLGFESNYEDRLVAVDVYVGLQRIDEQKGRGCEAERGISIYVEEARPKMSSTAKRFHVRPRNMGGTKQPKQ